MNSYKATRPKPKEERQKKLHQAVVIDRNVILDDQIDDDYGFSNVKGSGKWKNVSLLADTQLNADADMMKGLVCIQVSDGSEFATMRQEDIDKLNRELTRKPKKNGDKKELLLKNVRQNDAKNNAKIDGKKVAPKSAKLSAAEFEAKLIRQAQGGGMDLSSDSDDDEFDIAPLKGKKQSKEDIKKSEQRKKTVQEQIQSKTQSKTQPKTKQTKQPTTKFEAINTPSLESSKPIKFSKTITVQDDSGDDVEVGGLQWFDELSDDEYTKKEKSKAKTEKLKKKLQKELEKEKMSLSTSFNTEFEEMNDIDEDDELEIIDAYGDDENDDENDDEMVFESDEDDHKKSNLLTSLVKFGSDSDGDLDSDGDDRFIVPIAKKDEDDGDDDDDGENENQSVQKNNKKPTKSTSRTVSPYDSKIAPHMFPLKQYLTTTIQDVEDDEQDDLSSMNYYTSPNATIFHYHQDYHSWLPFNLHPFLQLAIIREKFTAPRPIQAESLLPALRDRKDIVGIAQTGSGKTLAFLFPILQHIIEQRQERGEIDSIWLQRQTALHEHEMHGKHFKDNLSALIITPTRELAMQINDQVKIFGGNIALIKPTLIVGGIFLEKQVRLVSQNAPIIIGTPGRIWDLMKSFGSPIDLTFLRFLVLDEADRMVQKGHFEELNSIIDHVKMALTRRSQEQDRVKEILLQRRIELQDAMRKQLEGDEVSDKIDKLNQENSKMAAGPNQPNNKRKFEEENDNKSLNKKSKFNPKNDEFKTSKPIKTIPKRRTIDYGPTFVDSESFDLDAYLDNIEKQRRGEEVPGKSTTKKGGKDGKNGKNGKNGKKNQPPTKKPKQTLRDMIESSDDDDGDGDGDDDGETKTVLSDFEDEDHEFDFLGDDEDDELLDEDDEQDELKTFIDSDLDIDPEDLIESDEENDENDENDGNDGNDTNRNNMVDLGMNSSELGPEAQSLKNKHILEDRLVEKYSNLSNKLPSKLQVFLFSATLTLQDSAREFESKNLKLSARDLSKKQGLLKKNQNVIESADEVAERQRQEALQKSREEGKSRLVELSRRLTLESPHIIDLTSALILPPTLQQYSIELAETTSRDASLYGLLYGKDDLTAIVFVNSINMTRKIADFLRCLNINAVALHGDTDQKGRMKVIDKFRKTCAQLQEQKLSKIENDREAGFEERELQARGVSSSHASTSYRSVNTPMKKYGCVLVCTDIVARGLDIPNLDLVVHYHVPFDSETYIHRCGRTARGTNFGKTVVLVSPQEDQQWRIIQHTLHVGIGKDQDIGRAVTSELDKTMKANKTSHSDHYNRGASPSNVSDVKKITFNSKYLVHIRDRLRYAHHIAESGVAEKANRKEQDYENKIFDALGFERDEFWYLTKKEKNRKQNEEGGLIAYEVNKDKHSLKRARFELNGLLRKNIWTQGGTFDW